MGSQNRGIIIQKNNGFNRGIIIQKNNGFTEQRYYNIEKQWVHRMGSMGSQNRGIIIQKNNGIIIHRIEVL